MRTLLLTVCVAGAVAAYGETNWLSRAGHNNDSVSGDVPNTPNGPAFTNNVYWMTWNWSTSEGVRNSQGFLDPTVDYCIYAQEKVEPYKTKFASILRTHGANDGNVVDSVFSGKSLTLTGPSGAQIYCYCKAPRKLRFENNGLCIDKGGILLMYTSVSTFDIYGTVEVTAKSLGGAFVRPHKNSARGHVVNFNDRFVGAGDAWFTVGGNDLPPVTCRIHDLSEFAGQITVLGGSTLAVAAKNPSSAEIEVRTGCGLSTVSATNVASVARLTMQDGAKIKLATAKDASGVTNGEIRVTNSLTLEGRVSIPFSYSALALDGTTNRFVVLTVPTTEDLDVGRFDLEIDRTGFPADAPFFGGLAVETNGVWQSLVVKCEPMVWLTTSDNDKQTNNEGATSAFSEGRESSWSDGRLPHPGAHYFVGPTGSSRVYLNSLGVGKTAKSDPPVSQVFAGESLTICSNGVLTLYASPTFTITNLCLLGGSFLRTGQYTSAVTVTGGVVRVPSGTVSLLVYSSIELTIASDLHGEALLKIPGIAGTSSYEGFCTLTGDNRNFTGKFWLSSIQEPNLLSRNQSLRVANEHSIGGSWPEGTFDAVSLTRMSKFQALNDISVPASKNFGIFIDGSEYFGRVTVSKNKTYRHASPLTLNGHMRKDGLGTLALGGELKFGPSGEGTQPIALSNRLDVAEGRLGIFGAGSVDGLEIAFSNNTSLVFMPDFSDADLTRDGIRNVKTDTPFVLAAGQSKLPLTFEFPSGAPPAPSIQQGVLTVSAAAAPTVRGWLPEPPSLPWPRYRAQWVESTDSGTGNVTFALDISIPGLYLLFR